MQYLDQAAQLGAAAAAVSPTLLSLTPDSELVQIHSLQPHDELPPPKEIPVQVGSLAQESELTEIEGADELEELLEVLRQVESRLDDAESELRSQTPVGEDIESQPQDKYVSPVLFFF